MRTADDRSRKRGQAAGGGLAPAAASGGGLRNVIGTPSTSRRYNLTLSMSIRNLLNHTNPGPIIGNITSPLFGQANQIFGSQNGEGFYETANNRRLENADPPLLLTSSTVLGHPSAKEELFVFANAITGATRNRASRRDIGRSDSNRQQHGCE